MSKHQDDRFGPDRHRIPLLMQMGKDCIDAGGSFETDVGDTYHSIGLCMQTKRQREYAEQYGSYYCSINVT
jgi:hypothetical protein